jgi:hypothetical protein
LAPWISTPSKPAAIALAAPLAEAVNQAGQLVGAQRAWHLVGHGAAVAVHRHATLGGNGRRRHRRAAVGLVAAVRHPAGVPQLQVDDAAAGVYRIRHLAPAGHLGGGVDARHPRVAMALPRHWRGLGDQQAAGRAALGIVSGVQRGGHVAVAGAHAGQRRHHHAVLQRGRAQGQRREEGFGHRRLGSKDGTVAVPQCRRQGATEISPQAPHEMARFCLSGHHDSFIIFSDPWVSPPQVGPGRHR